MEEVKMVTVQQRRRRLSPVMEVPVKRKMTLEERVAHIIQEELPYLKAFFPGLPHVKITSLRTDLDCIADFGAYYRDEQEIEIYYGHIARQCKTLEQFKLQVIETLAHEYQHHYQFTGPEREQFEKVYNEDLDNHVPYQDQKVEINARRMSALYLLSRGLPAKLI